MLILPVRPQPPRRHNQEDNDSCVTSSPARTSQDPCLAPNPPSRNTGAMMSVIPPSKPPMPKRPKLSLQTFAESSPLSDTVKTNLVPNTTLDTPTDRVASPSALALLQPPPTLVQQTPDSTSQTFSSDLPTPPLSNSSSVTSSSSVLTSPFPVSAPYSLPMGARSILRNSPLPRRHLPASTTRVNRRLFLPVKRVMFRELLEDIIPTPSVEYASDASSSDCGEKRSRAKLDNGGTRGRQNAAEDAPLMPVQRRRKRRREWVWRPLDDDILAVHHMTDDIDSQNTDETESTSFEKAKLASASHLDANSQRSPN